MCVCLVSTILISARSVASQPNIIIINIDDMGWGDFGAYGSAYAETPNVDQLASDGIKFDQFYAGAPICSPSRTALFTGQFASRSGINTFIHTTTHNANNDNVNHLSLSAPSMAQAFQDGGYATGHFGKWHMGGGRDVGYAVNPTPGTNASAPRVVEYGYDEAWTQFEGLGNRIINVQDYGGDAAGVTTRPSNYLNGLNQQSDERGTGGGLDQIVYLEREYNATFMVDRAIEFITDSKTADPNKPVFMNVWLDEVHTPHDPPAALKAKYDALYPSLPSESRNYLAVLEETDQQIGRLVDAIDQQGLGGETLILVMSDNGPTSTNADNIASAGPFQGNKGSAYEGGIRSPLVARWTGTVTGGQQDTTTVMAVHDLLPTLTSIANVAPPAGVNLDGDNLSDALLGVQPQTRSTPLYWNTNRGNESRHTSPSGDGAGANGEEVVAYRSGDNKLLFNADGTKPELYDLSVDPGETNNLAIQQTALVNQLASEALAIRYATPSRTLPDTATPVAHFRAESLAGQGDNTDVTTWNEEPDAPGFVNSVASSGSSTAPTVQTNELNGKAVIEFDGDDALVSSSNNSLPDPDQGLTVFAVATGDSSGLVAERLGQIGDNAGAAGQVVGFDMSNSTTGVSNGGAGFRFNNGASLYDTPIAANSDFHIVVWQVDQGQSYADATLFVDGTEPANTFTGSSNNPSGSPNFTGNDLELILGTGRLGGSLLSADYFTGQLAEFIVYNDQLSLGQINLIGNYLSSEYGLPFAYETSFGVFEQVVGLAWVGGTGNFDSAWNAGDGAGGLAGSNSDPFQTLQDMYLGNEGVVELNASTDMTAGNRINSLEVGSSQAGLVVNGMAGAGTLTVNDAVSLIIGDGAEPQGGESTGNLFVGVDGQSGTVNWNSTGTLDVEGRLRIGQGGVGVFNQNAGVVNAGDEDGSTKFIAVGSGITGDGTYHLNHGQLLPGGGAAGSHLRQLRVGYSGGKGLLVVGDGVGAAGSARLESLDDLYVGYEGGDGTLTIRDDGEVELIGNNAPVYIGRDAGSQGLVSQQGGSFESDGEFVIGQNTGATGVYEISGGTLTTAADGAASFRVGYNGGSGTLRVSGDAVVVHADSLTLGDGATGTEGLIELIGSDASMTVDQLANLAQAASETLRWVADAAGVTPLIVIGDNGGGGPFAPGATDFVQLQDPTEAAANTGVNGNGDLAGDGTALRLDLSALTGAQTVMLIDNRSSEGIVGFFEDNQTMNLYEEGESISNTGFNGQVTISYTGGSGNDVVLILSLLPGDFDGDGDVDATDIDSYIGKLGTTVPPEDAVFDLNGDNLIDLADYVQHATTLLEWDNPGSGQSGVGTLRGDFNRDGVVSLLDLNTLGANFGGSGGWSMGDTNGSGDITLLDLNALGANFGNAVVSNPAVPEPASLALLSLGGLALARRRA